ncbi:MAG: hypothetical protein JXB48_12360 [Candidatus Latescibacteria bacterium]|nr:hypothetical protein [Candidatus Latescibacterota bacterium]
MSQKNADIGTEWIFCRDIKGKCSGLNPKTKVLEKKPKTISIHGEKVKGWMVKIVQEQSEGHISLNFCDISNE